MLFSAGHGIDEQQCKCEWKMQIHFIINGTDDVKVIINAHSKPHLFPERRNWRAAFIYKTVK